MAYFFTLLLLIGIAMLIYGLFNPMTALFWKKTPGTRGQAGLIYGGASFILFLCIGITAPKDPGNGDISGSAGTGGKTAEAAPSEEDSKHRLALGQQVRVMKTAYGQLLNDDEYFLTVSPAGSRIVVREYNKGRQMYDGTLYDRKGGLLVPDAHFWPETVREVK